MTPQTQFTFDGQGVVLANRKDVVCRDVHPDYVNLVISAPSLYAALQKCRGTLELALINLGCDPCHIQEALEEAGKALDLGSSTPR